MNPASLICPFKCCKSKGDTSPSINQYIYTVHAVLFYRCNCQILWWNSSTLMMYVVDRLLPGVNKQEYLIILHLRLFISPTVRFLEYNARSSKPPCGNSNLVEYIFKCSYLFSNRINMCGCTYTQYAHFYFCSKLWQWKPAAHVKAFAHEKIIQFYCWKSDFLNFIKKRKCTAPIAW